MRNAQSGFTLIEIMVVVVILAVLGALVVPYLLRVLLDRPVRTRLRVDLEDLIRPLPYTMLEQPRRWAGLAGLWWALRNRRT